MALTLAFLALAIGYFFWNDYQSSRPRLTRTHFEEDPLLPVRDLVRAKVTQLGPERWELRYDFEALAGERAKLQKLLKDWKGQRVDPAVARSRKLPPHLPIKLSRATGLPLAPLFSQVSFQQDLEIEVDLEWVKNEKLRKHTFLWIFFYFFYDKEKTGTALRVTPQGQAQFVRYRRTFFYDEPRGRPGRMRMTAGKKTTIRIRVEASADNPSYRCTAEVDGRALTAAAFPPEWPHVGLQLYGEKQAFLVGDNPVPPQSGFVAILAGKEITERMSFQRGIRLFNNLRLHRIALRGTVAKPWRQQRSEFRRMLDGFEKDAKAKQRQGSAGGKASTAPSPKSGAGKAAPRGQPPSSP